MSRPARKNIHFKRIKIPIYRNNDRPYILPIPLQAKGRFAIVTNAGRAVVDAEGAFDVGARRVRKKRVVLMPQAGIKPVEFIPPATVTNLAGEPGRSRHNP
jgi:hypothetical protein